MDSPPAPPLVYIKSALVGTEVKAERYPRRVQASKSGWRDSDRTPIEREGGRYPLSASSNKKKERKGISSAAVEKRTSHQAAPRPLTSHHNTSSTSPQSPTPSQEHLEFMSYLHRFTVTLRQKTYWQCDTEKARPHRQRGLKRQKNREKKRSSILATATYYD